MARTTPAEDQVPDEPTVPNSPPPDPTPSVSTEPSGRGSLSAELARLEPIADERSQRLQLVRHMSPVVYWEASLEATNAPGTTPVRGLDEDPRGDPGRPRISATAHSGIEAARALRRKLAQA